MKVFMGIITTLVIVFGLAYTVSPGDTFTDKINYMKGNPNTVDIKANADKKLNELKAKYEAALKIASEKTAAAKASAEKKAASLKASYDAGVDAASAKTEEWLKDLKKTQSQAPVSMEQAEENLAPVGEITTQ